MKNYESWHKEKSNIEQNTADRVFFYEREARRCYLGANIGHQQDGKGGKFARPVLVFNKFNNEIFWALPVSTRVRIGKFYEKLYLPDGIDRSVILLQLRLIDAKRLTGQIGVISRENYTDIQKAITKQ